MIGLCTLLIAVASPSCFSVQKSKKGQRPKIDWSWPVLTSLTIPHAWREPFSKLLQIGPTSMKENIILHHASGQKDLVVDCRNLSLQSLHRSRSLIFPTAFPVLVSPVLRRKASGGSMVAKAQQSTSLFLLSVTDFCESRFLSTDKLVQTVHAIIPTRNL